MAFTPDTLSAVVQSISGAGIRMFTYETSDNVATLTGTDYFASAKGRGLRVSDLIFVSPLVGNDEPYTLVIETVDADGNGTAVEAGLGAALVSNNLSDLTDAALARTNLGLGTAALLDSGTASGTLKTLNADGAFSLNLSSTDTLISGVFGPTRRTAGRSKVTLTTASITGARATQAILMESVGSGTNGPDWTDYGLDVNVWKTNWETSTVLGEVDGMCVNVRQGEFGDSGGILINTAKVASANYGATGVEISMNWTDNAGLAIRAIGSTMAVEIPSTDVRGGGVGYMTGVSTGSGKAAYVAYGYTGGQWEYVMRASADLTEANEYFHITAPDHASGSGRLRASVGSQAAPTYSFKADDDTGMYLNGTGNLAFATGGAVKLQLLSTGAVIIGAVTGQGDGTLNVAGAVYVNNIKVFGADNGLGLKVTVTSALSNAAGNINTIDKYKGKTIWDDTSKKIMVADGPSATAAWWDADGASSITPA